MYIQFYSIVISINLTIFYLTRTIIKNLAVDHRYSSNSTVYNNKYFRENMREKKSNVSSANQSINNRVNWFVDTRNTLLFLFDSYRYKRDCVRKWNNGS